MKIRSLLVVIILILSLFITSISSGSEEGVRHFLIINNMSNDVVEVSIVLEVDSSTSYIIVPQCFVYKGKAVTLETDIIGIYYVHYRYAYEYRYGYGYLKDKQQWYYDSMVIPDPKYYGKDSAPWYGFHCVVIRCEPTNI